MQQPIQITFRGFPHSDAVEAKIREKAEKLDRFYPHIISCRVVVEAEHHHHHQGNLYHVRIDMNLPQKELVVSREHHDKQAQEDVYVAIRNAFNAAKRQLEDFARTQRGNTKAHTSPAQGTISRLQPADDYGIIVTADGREIYFHRNSVRGGDFDELRVGHEVRYTEEDGDRGPQASTVHV